MSVYEDRLREAREDLEDAYKRLEYADREGRLARQAIARARLRLMGAAEEARKVATYKAKYERALAGGVR
jgi:outer membrane protein TolC